MKKISAIIVLMLIIGISCRYLLFTSYVKTQKREFRQSLLNSGSSEMIRITLSEEQLFKNSKGVEWKEKNKELVIDGVFHEVVAVVKNGTQAVVYLIPDTKENELFKNYFCLTKGSDKNARHFFQLILSLVYLPHNNNFLKPTEQLAAPPLSQTHPFQLSQFHARLIKPPQAL